MLTPNPRIVFVKRPIGQYKAGEHTIFDSSKSIDIENGPLNGGFLTRLIFLSPEPYLRHRMQEPKESGYSSTWKSQASPTSFGLIEATRSEDSTIKIGTKKYSNTPWELYTVQPYAESRYNLSVHDPTPGLIDFDSFPFSPVENPDPAKLPWTAFAGPLGIPGFAAYFEGGKAYRFVRVTFQSTEMALPIYKRMGMKIDCIVHVLLYKTN